MIWVIFSRLTLGLRGASVSRTGCSCGRCVWGGRGAVMRGRRGPVKRVSLHQKTHAGSDLLWTATFANRSGRPAAAVPATTFWPLASLPCGLRRMPLLCCGWASAALLLLGCGCSAAALPRTAESLNCRVPALVSPRAPRAARCRRCGARSSPCPPSWSRCRAQWGSAGRGYRAWTGPRRRRTSPGEKDARGGAGSFSSCHFAGQQSCCYFPPPPIPTPAYTAWRR
jgi:hypothetical protein